MAAGRTQKHRCRHNAASREISLLNGAFYIQNAISVAGDTANVAYGGKAPAQCFFRATRNGQCLGLLALGVYLLPHGMPVKIVHMHMGIDHSRCYLAVCEINHVRALRYGNIAADFHNEMIFYQNTLTALPLLRYTIIKTPASQNLVFFIHTV